MARRSEPRTGATPLVAGLVIAALVLLAPPLAGQDVTDAERFTLLHDSLGALSTDYGNDVLKTIGSLLLAIGWLMMSEASRKFLRDNRQVRGTALVVVPLMAVSNAVWLINRFVVSEGKVRLLRELNYVSEAYYTGDRITLIQLSTDLTLHLALFAVLFAFVYSQRGSGDAPAAQALSG